MRALSCYCSTVKLIYALAVAEKACKPWVVECVFNALSELGCSGVKVALKSDAARELCELKKLAAAKRSSSTVPLEVPIRESKANGAAERAVRTWQGQFRTPKSHLESGIDCVLPREHRIFQWCVSWAASLLNRVAIQSHGRTVFEHATGHRMKTPVSCFGEAVLWTASALDKYDIEWADGVFLGVSGMGIGVLIGTKNGIVNQLIIGLLRRGGGIVS